MSAVQITRKSPVLDCVRRVHNTVVRLETDGYRVDTITVTLSQPAEIRLLAGPKNRHLQGERVGLRSGPDGIVWTYHRLMNGVHVVWEDHAHGC